MTFTAVVYAFSLQSSLRGTAADVLIQIQSQWCLSSLDIMKS